MKVKKNCIVLVEFVLLYGQGKKIYNLSEVDKYEKRLS